MNLRINNWSGIYALGYVLVSSGIQNWFRRYEFVGLENIPRDKPILFAPNHQNAFIDGGIIGYASGKPTYYLGRADVFQKPLGNFFLTGFNILPIYRERDGEDYREKNKGAFETFYKLLSKNRWMTIFPEGSHAEFKQIRGPLKKGVFRIAKGAIDYSGKDLDVHVVPVGIDYERHHTIGGSLFVQFGKPYRMLDHVKDTTEEQEAEYVNLVADLEQRLDEMMINVKRMDHYHLIRNSMIYFEDSLGISKRNLEQKFKTEKAFSLAAEKWISQNEEKAIELSQLEESFRTSLNSKNLKPSVFSRRIPGWVLIVKLLLIWPIALIGTILNYVPFMIPEWLVRKKVKDTNFHTSIKAILGPLCFMIFWIIEVVVFHSIVGGYWWMAFAGFLPISYWFAWDWWKSLKKFSGLLRFNRLRKNGQLEKELAAFDRLEEFAISVKSGS